MLERRKSDLMFLEAVLNGDGLGGLLAPVLSPLEDGRIVDGIDFEGEGEGVGSVFIILGFWAGS